ncbi:hypothetical protein [Burkholderia pseudomallei]|uniref:hypothetical protein n=1 Tax=Burkholderia pseudomallei TaxID=28450 RepID=UPI0005EA0143|nr:hypothetical protein [Burkholderia pseudomallei]CAJ3333470.1 Uncharacterised protein [Burkholderia pseudomallei]CAJ3865868.1 Uncharacterised protein [Burkholderia pseudomallei]CAJ3895892.1 Uncharacterised protein [Burkholderia pseudomallei]CAJ5633195.1 Uncharacterised protein [Burkholderia pseudomallei]CAJ7001539.1 Uncharacterised protein [Burkholderia pseudomallei]
MQSAIPTAIATYRTGDTEVSLYRVDDDYRFTVTVQGEQVSVGYRGGPNAKLRFTVYEGDPAFFRKLSMTQFNDVELGVWQCMRQVKH